jgi:hypothetical protein
MLLFIYLVMPLVYIQCQLIHKFVSNKLIKLEDHEVTFHVIHCPVRRCAGFGGVPSFVARVRLALMLSLYCIYNSS